MRSLAALAALQNFSRYWWMLSKKSLLGGNKQDFLKLLMGFVRSDVRDHIASQKNDHGPSYRHCSASQRRGSPKFTICEIFGVVRFSTFSTASVLCGHGVSLRVDAGTLLIRNGFTHYPQKQEAYRFFKGGLDLPSRIVMMDGSGGMSFDVL